MHPELSDELYIAFRDLLLARCGLYYPERKRGDLAHGLHMTLETGSYGSLTELYADIIAGGAAWDALLVQLTVGETYFFRNDAQFDVLREHILPELLARRASLRTLRLWSAGCATGEEPYSLAIVLNELLPHDNSWNVSILATDINPHFLTRAREALYGSWSFRQTPDALRDRYWSEETGRWRLHPNIRQMVRFARLNLAEPSYPAITNGTSMIDIILCRNVTIYFDELTTRQVAEQFYQALAPGGWLIVGHSEPQATIYHQFEVHNFPNTILYRKPLDTLLFPLGSKHPGFETNLQSVQPAIPQEPDTGCQAPLRQISHLKHQQAEVDITAIRQPFSSGVPNTWAIIAARLAQDDKPVAEALLRELLDADPTHVRALIMLGRLYADRADWTRAQQQCQFALEQEPLSIPAHYLLAQICEHQGQLDAALAAYRRTVYLDHSFIAGMLGMANIWRRMGHLANAQRYYHNGLKLLRKLSPTSPIPESDGATASDLITLVMRQLEAVAAR